MAQVTRQTSALSARASLQCRPEQCGSTPRCRCGTTNVETPPESYWGPCPSASLSTPQKSVARHHCTSPNHGESWSLCTFLTEPLPLHCCCGQRMLMSPWTQPGKQFNMCMLSTCHKSLSTKTPQSTWEGTCHGCLLQLVCHGGLVAM